MTRLFLCGDVMTGRGIDQACATSCDPYLHEPWVRDAREYVELAEQRNGPVPTPIEPAYVWGVARDEIERRVPDARIVNLETSITQSSDFWPTKDIHYRMHPDNVRCLTTAHIDCAVLANNHVLDLGYAGLDETLGTLDMAGIEHAGAGASERDAMAPAIIELGPDARVLVFALGDASSGIPASWRAHADRAGVNLIDDLSRETARYIAVEIAAARRRGDVVVASIHWGSNWGYGVDSAQREFAQELIKSGVVDIVHGHSSHHAKAIEVFRGRPIFYGCGDLINDYEGVAGYEEYRGDLALLYFVDIEPDTGVRAIDLVPLRRERLSLSHASAEDAAWLAAMLDGDSRGFNTRASLAADKSIKISW